MTYQVLDGHKSGRIDLVFNDVSKTARFLTAQQTANMVGKCITHLYAIIDGVSESSESGFFTEDQSLIQKDEMAPGGVKLLTFPMGPDTPAFDGGKTADNDIYQMWYQNEGKSLAN